MIWLPLDMIVPGFVSGRGYYLGFGNVRYHILIFVVFRCSKIYLKIILHFFPNYETARFHLPDLFDAFKSDGQMSFRPILCYP